jgi:hypothetical protein
MVKTKPNGHMLFKTALGTETKVSVHVKISGPVCIWLLDGTKLYLPNMGEIKEQTWYKEYVKEYGECQGIVQDINKVVVPGEVETDRKPNW